MSRRLPTGTQPLTTLVHAASVLAELGSTQVPPQEPLSPKRLRVHLVGARRAFVKVAGT